MTPALRPVSIRPTVVTNYRKNIAVVAPIYKAPEVALPAPPSDQGEGGAPYRPMNEQPAGGQDAIAGFSGVLPTAKADLVILFTMMCKLLGKGE